MVASLLPTSMSKKYKLTVVAASPRPPNSRTRAPHARGAQEWRDAERTPGYVRYMDELNSQGGCADKSGTQALLLKL